MFSNKKSRWSYFFKSSFVKLSNNMPSNFLLFDMALAISLLTHLDLAELCDNNAKQ